MNYWIYPGERRPVVVRAETEQEAIALVKKSSVYDGFPVSVYTVEKYEAMCARVY